MSGAKFRHKTTMDMTSCHNDCFCLLPHCFRNLIYHGILYFRLRGQFLLFTNEPPHDKTNKMTVRPAKTQISLGIRPVWSESSLCVQWVAKDSEDSDQTGRMPRLICFRWAHRPYCWFCHVAAQMKRERISGSPEWRKVAKIKSKVNL